MSEPLRVLMIEDVESDATLIVRHLEKAGKAIESRRVEAESELWDALLHETFDIVLSDFSLPGFDANRALAVVREVDPDLPFIVVSGTIGDESAVELMKAGADDFLRKENLARLVPAVEREIADGRQRAMHRAAERALRESDAHLRIALKSGRITVFNQDRDLRITWACDPSPGFTAEDVLGKTDAVLFPPDEATRIMSLKSRVMETGEPAREEVRSTIDGNVTCQLLSVEPWRDETGETLGVVCASVDITEIKEAELQIREQLVELRRWQEVTLGREGRVVLLKREVNDLLRELGRPARYESAEIEMGPEGEN